LPQAVELGKGTHWADLTGFTRRDHLAAAQVLPVNANGYVFLTTLAGVVKRIRVEDLPGITSQPFTVMNVPDEDALGWAELTSGEDEVMLATAAGQAIRFKEEEVRPSGLPAGGVYGIKLANEADGVIAMSVVDPAGYLWSITDNGLAKATPMSEYPTQGRHGQGVRNMSLPKDAAEVVAALIGLENTQILITTAVGSTKKLKLDESYIGSRAIKPRSVMSVGPRNQITGALRMMSRPEIGEQLVETAVVPQQLSLIASPNGEKKKKK
jgi:DNA gyrase subunit A